VNVERILGLDEEETEALVVRLLPIHPARSAEWFGTLVRERCRISVFNLADSISDADTKRIAEHLLPVLRSWETRERVRHTLTVATSLGRRIRVLPELFRAFENCQGFALQEWAKPTSSRRSGPLFESNPLAILESAEELVREDGSWVTRYLVHTYLHRRWQDLLTPFLGRQAARGRFSTGKTRFVLPLREGFQRRTARQQATFASARCCHPSSAHSQPIRSPRAYPVRIDTSSQPGLAVSPGWLLAVDARSG